MVVGHFEVNEHSRLAIGADEFGRFQANREYVTTRRAELLAEHGGEWVGVFGDQEMCFGAGPEELLRYVPNAHRASMVLLPVVELEHGLILAANVE